MGASRPDWSGRDWSNPHDVMAMLPLIFPDDFGYNRGTVSIGQGGIDDGTSRIRADAAGTVQLMASWDARRVHDQILSLVLAGCERAVSNANRG
jgi:hypothetical protein